MKQRILIVLCSFFFLLSCSLGDKESKSWTIALPSYFPSLNIPDKNPMNQAKIELGARLFYDPLLSRDSTISCASCHFAEFAFSDHQVKSKGFGNSQSVRNSPVLFNLAYAPYLMMDGGVPSLELQIVAPLMHEGEMAFDLFELEQRLSRHIEYQNLAEQAFGRALDAGAIAYAIAAFERSLLSYQSKYDNFLSGEKLALNSEEIRGRDLFFSDSLNCNACHAGFNFTDYGFYNIGLYDHYEDPGRWRVTEDSLDLGKFKVPTLRNIEFSAPYMHDGSIADLEEVISFKMSGGAAHPNKSEKVKGFKLNEKDQKALLSFLYSLSDPIFVAREIDRREKL